jgi:hypothetical protein
MVVTAALWAAMNQNEADAAGRAARGSSPMRSSGVWPNYPNYGNPVGAAYSKAAGMRQGQWFGTFGLHPADARARGAY